MLVIAALLIVFLGYFSYAPIRNLFLRQQAMASGMVDIPAGDYLLGKQLEPEDNPSDFLPYDTYPMGSFSIDPYPVTNKRYVFCIQAGACSRPDALQSEYADPAHGDKLVVNITAIDAAEFCAWLGLRLPSEKEWEVAVRKQAFRSISPDALTDVPSFYEWTITPYDLNEAEWTDISTDPPEWITQKGGQLIETFEEYIHYRQDQLSTLPDTTTGFRCVNNQ